MLYRKPVDSGPAIDLALKPLLLAVAAAESNKAASSHLGKRSEAWKDFTHLP